MLRLNQARCLKPLASVYSTYHGFDRTGRGMLMVFWQLSPSRRMVTGLKIGLPLPWLKHRFSRFSHMFGFDRLPSCPTSL